VTTERDALKARLDKCFAHISDNCPLVKE